MPVRNFRIPFPAIVEKFDELLLKNYPVLWSGRIHRYIFLLIFFVGGYFYFISILPLSYTDKIVKFESIVICSIITTVILFSYWAYNQTLFSFRQNHGITSWTHEVKISVVFFVVLSLTILVLLFPPYLYSQRIKNFYIEPEIEFSGVKSGFSGGSYGYDSRFEFYKETLLNYRSDREKYQALTGIGSLFLGGFNNINVDTKQIDSKSFIVVNYSDEYRSSIHSSGKVYLDYKNVTKQTIALEKYTKKDITKYEIPIVHVTYLDSVQITLTSYNMDGKYFDKNQIHSFLMADSINNSLPLDEQINLELLGLGIELDTTILYLDKLEKLKNEINLKEEEVSKFVFANNFSLEIYSNLITEIDSLEELLLKVEQHELFSDREVFSDFDHIQSRYYSVFKALNGSDDLMSILYFSLLVGLILSYYILFFNYVIKFFGRKIFWIGILVPIGITYAYLGVQSIIFSRYIENDLTREVLILLFMLVFMFILTKYIKNRQIKIVIFQFVIYMIPLEVLLVYLSLLNDNSIQLVSDPYINIFNQLYSDEEFLDKVSYQLIYQLLFVISFYLSITPPFSNRLYRYYSEPIT